MESQRQATQIDVLPDDVLLNVFEFYVDSRPLYRGKRDTERWKSLIHVCRRWRSLVLGSSRRLNLRLFCTLRTPARNTLDIWPALPIIVQGSYMDPSSGTDNLIAALVPSNRVYKVLLSYFADWQLEKVLVAMQAPFPELIELWLISDRKTLPIIPDSFLDGSAPRLRNVVLSGISFPGLPTLLLSATHLVELRVSKIPHPGYISPDAMAALLSVLSSLERLDLEFESPQSRPEWETRRPPTLKRSVIPALTTLSFKGVTEYIEDLMTFIHAPQLDGLQVYFFNQIDFDIPRLARFISRTPRLWTLKRNVLVHFDDFSARVELRYGLKPVEIKVSCEEPDWQLSFIEQICNPTLHPLSIAEALCIDHQYRRLIWKDDAIENTLWLRLFLPFTAVKNLYLFRDFAPGIAATLQELVVWHRITEVLPSLQNIFVEGLEPSGPIQAHIQQFVAARRLSGHTIAVSGWNTGRR